MRGLCLHSAGRRMPLKAAAKAASILPMLSASHKAVGSWEEGTGADAEQSLHADAKHPGENFNSLRPGDSVCGLTWEPPLPKQGYACSLVVQTHTQRCPHVPADLGPSDPKSGCRDVSV